jgi:hypothetical protein
MLLTACTYARGRTVLRYSDGCSEPGSGICFRAALLQQRHTVILTLSFVNREYALDQGLVEVEVELY